MSGPGAHSAPYRLGSLSAVNRRLSFVGAVGDTLSHARDVLVTVGQAQVKTPSAHGLGGPATPYGVGAFSGVGCAVRTNRPYIRSLP